MFKINALQQCVRRRGGFRKVSASSLNEQSKDSRLRFFLEMLKWFDVGAEAIPNNTVWASGETRCNERNQHTEAC